MLSLKGKYNNVSVNSSRERERERETERDRQTDRQTDSWICLPTSLTNTQISGDSALYNLILWRQLTATFVLGWLIVKIENNVIIIWSMRDN